MDISKSNFEHLEVYQLAERLSDAVWKMVLDWDYFARDTVGKQIVRSADSVGANIAEGTGQTTYKSNRSYVRIARSSLLETKHWLRRAHHRNLLTDQDVQTIKPLLAELLPRLNAYMNSIGRTSN